MNDLEIKEYLMGYIIEEMELLQEKDMHGYEHVFSPKFDKRIKKILWSEKYFGKNLKVGYFVRKVAIIFIVLATLFTVGEVSAKVFGFNLLKKLRIPVDSNWKIPEVFAVSKIVKVSLSSNGIFENSIVSFL